MGIQAPRPISTQPSGGMLQAKLSVGRVDDPLEHEADRVADQVMTQSGESGSVSYGSPPTVQRKCSACAEEDQEKVLRKESASAPIACPVAPPSVQNVLRSSGHAFDAAARADFESRFGLDFSRVRIHSDAHAAKSAHEIGALAYTVGSHVVFADGLYQPTTLPGRRLLAHELAHVAQQISPTRLARGISRVTSPVSAYVARQPKTTVPTTTPTACTVNCTDPAFTALSEADRTTQFDQQCPSGYPLSKTFFGQPIPAQSLPKLRSKLLEAEAKAKRAMCINGKDPNAYQLDRAITTYAGHSPGEDKAVDIDVQGQPFIMHEHGEADVDAEVAPVYNRIQHWVHYTKSIIPKGITSVGAGKGGRTSRTWTNPETGQKENITTGELYDKLKAESVAMTDYFGLLLKTDRQLQIELEAFILFDPDPMDAVAKLGFPTGYTDADMKALRERIANDYRLLGGSKAQLENFAGPAVANLAKEPKALAGPKEDRPFAKGAVAGATQKGGAPDPAANRRPELGFIVLPKEVVVALTEVGLVWGAVDFGGESGDVMHFDCRNIC
jgi:hypothetical protein